MTKKDTGYFTEDLTENRNIYEVAYMWARRLEDTISYLQQKGRLEDAKDDLLNVLNFNEKNLFAELRNEGQLTNQEQLNQQQLSNEENQSYKRQYNNSSQYKEKIIEASTTLQNELNSTEPSRTMIIDKGTELVHNLKPYLKNKIDRRC